MSHPFFDRLPIPEQDLTPAEVEHLRACPRCQQRQSAWESVERQLRSQPMARPTPGFTRRWQANLAERRLLQQKLQVRRLFLGLVLANGFTLLALALQLFLTTSPAGWLSEALQVFVRIATLFAQVQTTWLTWSQVVSPVLLVALAVGLVSILAVLSLVWLTTLWRISYKRSN